MACRLVKAMATSTFDCYLCGTANPSDADYCVQCGGQLLKVADAENHGDLPDAFENPFAEPSEPAQIPNSQPPDAPKKPARKVHASIEDQRLSDALGLTEKAEQPRQRPRKKQAVQKQSSGQPQPTGQRSQADPGQQPPQDRPLGPQRGQLPPTSDPRAGLFSSRGDEEVGPIAWVIVGVLFLAVGWLGYFTLLRTDDRPTPESIGFVAETTTLPPTTTIPEDEELTTLQEVDSEYDASLVRIVPFACEAGQGDQSGEPVVGVAINERSVLVGPALPAGTNAVRIVTRTGASRVAILSQVGGATIATSNARTSRNLDIEAVGAEASFYLAFDLESNEVTTTETSQGTDVEIEVSDTGLVHQVRAGTTNVSAQQLAAIDLTIEIDEEARRRGGATCNEANAFSIANPAPDEATEETVEEETVEETDE